MGIILKIGLVIIVILSMSANAHSERIDMSNLPRTNILNMTSPEKELHRTDRIKLARLLSEYLNQNISSRYSPLTPKENEYVKNEFDYIKNNPESVRSDNFINSDIYYRYILDLYISDANIYLDRIILSTVQGQEIKFWALFVKVWIEINPRENIVSLTGDKSLMPMMDHIILPRIIQKTIVEVINKNND